MKKLKCALRSFAILSVTLALSSCAFGMGSRRPTGPMPVRKCPQSLWVLLGTSPCIMRKLEDGSFESLCPGDLTFPKDLAAITLEGYNCERNYQDLLINKCREYKP
jgi:hypothetical protein